MSSITVAQQINAPVSLVFKTVSDIRDFSKAVTEIMNVEFLTEREYGIGTKFRETRNMNGREVSTELEVTEFKENEHIRIISDTMGTIWDSTFTVKAKENGTELILMMDANAYKLLPKLINPFMKGVMQKALEKDLLAVKQYCEADHVNSV